MTIFKARRILAELRPDIPAREIITVSSRPFGWVAVLDNGQYVDLKTGTVYPKERDSWQATSHCG